MRVANLTKKQTQQLKSYGGSSVSGLSSSLVFTPVQGLELVNPELAAKKANQVYGRPETDKKGIDVLTRCLRLGNVAWYRCVVEAKAPDELKRCHSRYLLPADEIPKASP